MEANENIRQIEINGIKMEVDLRTCKQISTYKVGDNVKILKKNYDKYEVYSGVIVDFVNFKERPAIVIAYFVQDYSGVSIKFETITQNTTDVEFAPCLPHELKINKDGRAAYGALNEKMASLIRAFRDLPGKHVLMTAKLEKSQDEMGRMLYNPSMPGKSLTQQLPYHFDFCFPLRVEKDGEGNTHRALMCDSDGLWLAKSRSHVLDAWEEPNLGDIIRKIGGEA